VIHLWESHFNASPAIFLLASVKNFFDEEIVRVIFVWCVCGFEPLVVSASGDTRYFTEETNIIF